MYYPDTLRPALQTIGTAAGVEHIAGLYMLVLEKDVLFFADTTVNIDPDAQTLADIAVLSAGFVRWLGLEPKVAMLSFSNFGSVQHPEAEKVKEAVRIVKTSHPDLMIDGEMQVDAAADAELRQELYPFSTLVGNANVYIFPDLNAANMAYKLMARLGGAEAIGPILIGMAEPVQVLQRGSTAADIVNLTAIAVVDAQERSIGKAFSDGISV
jgi:malate dehydrogenase (oxaloacetate-decarboxylating)(NADP+)